MTANFAHPGRRAIRAVDVPEAWVPRLTPNGSRSLGPAASTAHGRFAPDDIEALNEQAVDPTRPYQPRRAR